MPLDDQGGRTLPLPVPARTSGAPALLLVYHRDGAQAVSLAWDRPVVLGRGEGADIRVRDTSLSRQHARFTLRSDGLAVEDLGSTNGTCVDGRRVTEAVVRPGETVMLGAIAVVLQGGGAADGLEGHERMLARIADEVERARWFRRPFVLVLVEAPRHLSGWVAAARELLRAVDRAALYGPTVLEVLLPETPAEEGLALARTLVAAIPGARAGVASFPASATSVDGLVEAARASLDRAARDGVPLVAAGAGEEQETGDAVFASAPMRALLGTVRKVAASSISVLLVGETGSGKEVVARLIHEHSDRARRRLVTVNCAAIAPTLLESTLFGFEKGAFTGAARQTRGVFEEADGSTVFLDEIGELPPPAQAALLRVLEVHAVTRVGSAEEIPVDVRILAATHNDLEAMERSGRFRSDLLYRLNPITLRVPPLRERREDVIPLAWRFLARANVAHRRTVRTIHPDALALLLEWRWPGNVRELRNVVDRAAVVAEDDAITPADLPDRLREGAPESPLVADAEAVRLDFHTRVERFEVALILDGLERAGWNQTRAAEVLGLPRRTLIHKMQAYGIRRGGYAAPETE